MERLHQVRARDERPLSTRLLPAPWALASIRVRILVGFIGMLALATAASVLVAREVLFARLDERISDELIQESSELRRLAKGIDPATSQSFGGDVRRIFRVYFTRNTPSRGEALLTFVDGEPFLRSSQVVPYRLDRDPELVARWGSLTQTDRGEVSTPAGRVDYLALPLQDENGVRGVFVVAVFRELQQGPFDDAILATGAVGLAVLLIGSLLVWRMAESVLRPVRSVTQTARAITETDFTRRIDVQGRDEVAELAMTFNATLDRLESAFMTQRRFIDDAGHDLRTPLTIVRGHLELLPDDPEQRDATLALVLDELDRMGRTVDDLIVLAKSESPDFLHLETVDVGSLTEAVHTKMATLAPRRWAVDRVGRGLMVADRQRLTQALIQLAENATKHTGPGDEIAIGSVVENGEVRFWIRDQGAGIAEHEQPRVFERFMRGAGSSRSEGAGLGLSIVHAIAQAHHGRVELASRAGAGATFTLVLPVDQPPPMA